VLHLVKRSQGLFALGWFLSLTVCSLACSVPPLHSRLDAASDDDAPVDSPETGHTGGASGSIDSGAGGHDDSSSSSEHEGGGGAVDAVADTAPRPDATSGAGGSSIDAGGAGGAGDAGKEALAPTCAACTAWGTPVAEGPSPAALDELSGLAASRLHPGIFYAHNDSGDSARFYALDAQAHVNAEFHLTGATAVDWEDISVGPCPTGSCIYIGDTGDNKLDRNDYVIHRMAEPASMPSDGSVVSVSYESFPYAYPNAAHYNVEALLVHPTTGQVFLITKDSGVPAAVYELPLPLKADAGMATTVLVTSLAISPVEGAVTDGAFHPCGDRVLIRTNGVSGLFELSRTPGQSLSALFSSAPVRVPVAAEPQGEAVTYTLDGRHYVTASETVSESPVPSVSVVSCTN
jgi:hypothetical protein